MRENLLSRNFLNGFYCNYKLTNLYTVDNSSDKSMQFGMFNPHTIYKCNSYNRNAKNNQMIYQAENENINVGIDKVQSNPQ